MSKSSLQVTKIVAPATDIAWSQAYHAGGLTALLSVKQKKETKESPSLAIVGKDLLNTFESEYFTLEKKNLETIGKAVEETYKKSAETHDISLIVAACVQNALYVTLAGTGSVKILRKGQLGTILSREDLDENNHVLAASGFLEQEDIVILETPGFSHQVSEEKIKETLTDGSLVAAGETLTPLIHAQANGSEAALFFLYKDESTAATPSLFTPASQQEHHHEEKQEEQTSSAPPPEPAMSEETPLLKEKKKGLTHRQKIFLTISFILILVLGATIYFSLKKTQEAKQAALFKSIYDPAQQQYQEGQGLVNLNAEKARNDFQQAINTLQTGKDKFPAGSTEEEQITTLLSKVQQSLSDAADINTVSMQKLTASDNPFLTFEAKQQGNYATFDTTNFYTADDTGVTRYNQKTNANKVIIKNASDWKKVGGFGTYLGNFYILDTQAGILKYVAAGSSFAKANYFASGVSPDLSKAVSLTIDGSMWVLTSGGNVLKFTKGKADTFSISGLDKPLVSPTRMVTSVDDTNLYILDSGNARLVVFDKTGKYLAQYQSEQLKDAKNMTIDEKNKKADFLVGSDIYELTFK